MEYQAKNKNRFTSVNTSPSPYLGYGSLGAEPIHENSPECLHCQSGSFRSNAMLNHHAPHPGGDTLSSLAGMSFLSLNYENWGFCCVLKRFLIHSPGKEHHAGFSFEKKNLSNLLSHGPRKCDLLPLKWVRISFILTFYLRKACNFRVSICVSQDAEQIGSHFLTWLWCNMHSS